MTEDRTCGWCGEAIPPWMRVDALTCSQPCRQKLHRFGVAPASSRASKPLRFAYADPPYPGFAEAYYDRPEVDHVELIAMLERQFTDGWALSTSSKTIVDVMAMIKAQVDVDRVRTGAWVKGSRPGKAWNARDAWEPLIVVGGRPRQLDVGDELDNVLVLHTNARQRTKPGSLIGMKSGAFCEWLFQMLGAARGDELVDIFPGSGIVSLAWERYTREPSAVDARRKPSRLEDAMRRGELEPG